MVPVEGAFGDKLVSSFTENVSLFSVSFDKNEAIFPLIKLMLLSQCKSKCLFYLIQRESDDASSCLALPWLFLLPCSP